jgi:predicted phosphoribosyltransferase
LRHQWERRRWFESLGQEVDEVVDLVQPTHMLAVGVWYEGLGPTGDAEIVELLGG